MIEEIPENYQDCETFLISALLYSPKYWVYASDIIKPQYLYDETNRKIWQAMVDLKNFDTRKIIQKLDGNVNFKDIMRIEGLSIGRLITEFEVKKLAWLTVECYKKTEINRIKEDITNENLQELISKINEINRINEPESTEDSAEEFSIKVDRLCRGESDSRVISTGYESLDKVIDGFRKSELVILGGRPGSGKTTLAMNLACNIARKHKNVLFFSLEMSAVELHERLVTSLAEIRPQMGLDNDSAQKLLEVSAKIRNILPLKIDDRASLTIEDIYSEVKKAKDSGKCDLVVVDHMSILKSKKSFKSRYEEVSDVSRQLKIIAKEMDIPVLCLCQLNRGVEGRELKAPTMADLRDSGSIEQDADLIFFVYRQEYYIRQREPEDFNSAEHIRWEEDLNKVRGRATLVLAKNRRGETGTIPMYFNGKYSKFTEA